MRAAPVVLIILKSTAKTIVIYKCCSQILLNYYLIATDKLGSVNVCCNHTDTGSIFEITSHLFMAMPSIGGWFQVTERLTAEMLKVEEQIKFIMWFLYACIFGWLDQISQHWSVSAQWHWKKSLLPQGHHRDVLSPGLLRISCQQGLSGDIFAVFSLNAF